MKRIYIAGPCTGYPDFNYPAFHAEAARLRALGYQVVNPAENPQQDSWADYMRQDIPMLLTCDTVALLPNWADSKGAALEHHIASELGIRRVMAADIREPHGDPLDQQDIGMVVAVGGHYAIQIDENNGHFGWVFWKHPDGMWVSQRKASEAELQNAQAVDRQARMLKRALGFACPEGVPA